MWKVINCVENLPNQSDFTCNISNWALACNSVLRNVWTPANGYWRLLDDSCEVLMHFDYILHHICNEILNLEDG